MVNVNELAAQLIEHYSARRDNGNRYHADCPFCGASARARGNAIAYRFYFIQYDADDWGAWCWSCGYKASLTRFVQDVGLDIGAMPSAQPVAAFEDDSPREPLPWQHDDALSRLRAATARMSDAVAIWQAYKPLTAATIERYGLTCAKIPYWRDGAWKTFPQSRICVPILKYGKVVGMRGRDYRVMHGKADHRGGQWKTASGSETWLNGLDEVQAGQQVVICENLVDRLLALQHEPSVMTCASGGLLWRDEWSAIMAQRKPRHVLIWLDHDLSGNGSTHHAAEFEAEWRAGLKAQGKNDKAPLRTPAALTIAASLRAHGVTTYIYDWPRGTPRGYDLGAYLMEKAYANV